MRAARFTSIVYASLLGGAAIAFSIAARAQDVPAPSAAPPQPAASARKLPGPNDPLPTRRPGMVAPAVPPGGGPVTPPWLKPPATKTPPLITHRPIVAPTQLTHPNVPPSSSVPTTSPAPSESTPATSAPPATHRAPRKKPKPPPVPSPTVKLTLTAASPDGPWTLRAENVAKVPVQILADARLLAIDVALADGKHVARCELPSAMRPNDVDDRVLVVPPGRAYVEKIDPRLFCFGAHASEALIVGAKITPTITSPTSGVNAVRAIDGIEPAMADEKDLVGVATEIGAGDPRPVANLASPGSRPLAIATPAFADAARAQDADLEVTVTNVATTSTIFLFRTGTLVFDVTGPSGVGVTDPSPTVRCAADDERFSPIPEVFTTLAPKGHVSMGVLLAAVCPDKTFDHPGLYVVRAKLDTRRGSGRSVGIATFDGEATAATTTRLRVQTTASHGRAPRPEVTPLTTAPTP